MTTSITPEVSARIRSELKARNIPLSVVSAFAGYGSNNHILKQLRELRLQPRTVAALNKCLIDL